MPGTQQPWVFLLRMIILGVKWGYHHLRKHPYTPCNFGFANHILYNLNKIHIQDLFHTHEFQQDLPYLPALLRRQQGLIEVLSQLILISGMNSKCGRQWFTRKNI